MEIHYTFVHGRSNVFVINVTNLLGEILIKKGIFLFFNLIFVKDSVYINLY